jgi:hypothetical protein
LLTSDRLFSTFLAIDAPEGFIAPRPHSIWILLISIIGAIIALGIATWVIFNLVSQTRERLLKKKRDQAPNRQKLRDLFMKVLDDIEEKYKNKELGDEDAYYEVSKVLRQYASEKTGNNLKSFTLTEIAATPGLGTLEEVVSDLYNAEFFDQKNNPKPPTPLEAIEWGRSLIKRWA